MKPTFKIKNYTSAVPVERTIARIEQALAKAGAASVVKEYGPAADVAALKFDIDVGGSSVTVHLPVNARALASRLHDDFCARQRRVRREYTAEDFLPQAERTAWKLMQDWVEVQLSLIALKQADFLAVFLPYVYNSATRTTFYERLKASGMRGLLPEKASG
jgi:hypothetical protein